jgi:hypothetical protein
LSVFPVVSFFEITRVALRQSPQPHSRPSPFSAMNSMAGGHRALSGRTFGGSPPTAFFTCDDRDDGNRDDSNDGGSNDGGPPRRVPRTT